MVVSSCCSSWFVHVVTEGLDCTLRVKLWVRNVSDDVARLPGPHTATISQGRVCRGPPALSDRAVYSAALDTPLFVLETMGLNCIPTMYRFWYLEASWARNVKWLSEKVGKSTDGLGSLKYSPFLFEIRKKYVKQLQLNKYRTHHIDD